MSLSFVMYIACICTSHWLKKKNIWEIQISSGLLESRIAAVVAGLWHLGGLKTWVRKFPSFLCLFTAFLWLFTANRLLCGGCLFVCFFSEPTANSLQRVFYILRLLKLFYRCRKMFLVDWEMTLPPRWWRYHGRHSSASGPQWRWPRWISKNL